MNPELFDQTATELWELNWGTIVSIKAVNDKERGALEAIIQKKYGKTVSLKGTSDQVRNALIAAKR